jgi:dTDP-4-amino-4,6-dideoxygalactose transaminase
MANSEISTGVHYPIPVHLQPAFAGLGYRLGDFPISERLAGETLSLPIFPEMTSQQIDQVCDALRPACRIASLGAA